MPNNGIFPQTYSQTEPDCNPLKINKNQDSNQTTGIYNMEYGRKNSFICMNLQAEEKAIRPDFLSTR
jgi:hypothetical protein